MHGFFGNIGTRVFEGSTPNLQRALQEFKDERHLWLLAGAKRLAALGEGRVDAH